ncbi:glucoamylase family protein [Homoserinibacter sp. YIM 151385]|uniref:glucoamylase family protein n=1 Tax=Homoserinibacter sp. YIM 151385 TaxID=2985506 RepID=UPI0022F0EF38|nr:glucoamylase family protein [Homoserinibacter sp. YIM 151385]WBU37636.1 DUF3131 domain-containing protein [Homoserinibacter sp. YIM 151385]
MHRRIPLLLGAAVASLALAVPPAAASAATASPASQAGGDHDRGRGGDRGHDPGTGRADTRDLTRWAADTWASLDAMTDPRTGLAADHIDAGLETPSEYTSPTNIGGYLWSTVAARDAGIISTREARERMRATLDSLEVMERHEPSGQFYNWYSPTTREKLTEWPGSGDPLHPFLSTVDNGWLAASLRIVAAADRKLERQATGLYRSMDFSWFHDLEGREGKNLNRGGFWVEQPGETCAEPGNYGDDGPDVYYTCHWYDTTVSEARIATYIGIANGQIPASAYYTTYRTMPDQGCDFGWQEQKPEGETRTYRTGRGETVETYEGTYAYDGMRLVPAWGGSMFEALMPDLLVPEADWGKRSWAANHEATVRAQIHHGLDEAGYGYWGFSPSSNPEGGYREYGVESIGISSDGYGSDVEKTDVDLGYEGCREAANPEPDFGDGVVTPHAAFLALPYEKRAAIDNLRRIETELGAYGKGGFLDAATTSSGQLAQVHLSLDQSMIMAAISNELSRDALKGYFVDRAFERTVRPLVAQQRFGTRLR